MALHFQAALNPIIALSHHIKNKESKEYPQKSPLARNIPEKRSDDKEESGDENMTTLIVKPTANLGHIDIFSSI